MDWIGATQATKDATIADYLARDRRASIDEIGGPVNLVGDCQGGWLATIYAALHPEHVNTLTIAGAPIDFHAGDAVIHDSCEALSDEDLRFYENMVGLGNGVLKGEFMLNGFIAIKPENELGKQLQLLANLHDDAHVDRYRGLRGLVQAHAGRRRARSTSGSSSTSSATTRSSRGDARPSAAQPVRPRRDLRVR